MKTYTVLYAEDVPHYAAVEIQAADDGEAVERAKSHDFGDAALEPEWNNAACKRIVHIEDDAGNILSSGISLDSASLLYGSDVRDAVQYALECLHSFKADWLANHGLNLAVEKLEAAYSNLGASMSETTSTRPRAETEKRHIAALMVPTGQALKKGRMYLRLFHGRNTPDENLEDWGFSGPTFGPLEFFHITYLTTFRFARDEFEHELSAKHDPFEFEGKYYGDLLVFVALGGEHG